ncbi:MAG: 50S ribosomal protein L1 [Candidatus Aenigmarchaeota archaeon]|nr:50S ribosomal protein L1 [Candidatus Aenigmarchaeota archaeon]
MKIDDALKYLRENSKQRKFAQSVDLIINLKNIDLKKPENKFSKEVLLPNGRGKEISVGIISDKISGAVTKADIETFEKDKKKLKQFTKQYDFTIAEAPLMPLVGKVLGRHLAPRGRMPKLLPPGRNPQMMVDELKNSVRIRVRDSPTIQVLAGSEEMSDVQLKENVGKILDEVSKSLPKGKNQIKDIHIKMTMGKPVKIDI